MSGDPLVEELVLRLKQGQATVGRARHEVQVRHVSGPRWSRWRCAEVVEDPPTGSNAGGAIGGRALEQRQPIAEMVGWWRAWRTAVICVVQVLAREPRHLGRVEDTPDVRDK